MGLRKRDYCIEFRYSPSTLSLWWLPPKHEDWTIFLLVAQELKEVYSDLHDEADQTGT